MPTLYLRDVPESLLAGLRRRARRNRRSMNAEAVAILQQAFDDAVQDGELTKRLRSLQYTVPPGGPTAAELVRQGRDELDRRHRR